MEGPYSADRSVCVRLYSGRDEMSKDLEKIKQHVYVLGGDEPETIGQQSAGIIISCAERMDKENKELKTIISKLSAGLNNNGCAAARLVAEVNSLKAKLASGSERVKCEECKYKEEENASCLSVVRCYKKSVNPHQRYHHYEINFCSRGERKK
jgi:hypothetical protein